MIGILTALEIWFVINRTPRGKGGNGDIVRRDAGSRHRLGRTPVKSRQEVTDARP